MRILISGSHGLIGSALIDLFANANFDVVRLVRQRPDANSTELFWNPADSKLDIAQLENFDAIIHLGGINITKKRWTKKI